jgi:hypothetical protein
VRTAILLLLALLVLPAAGAHSPSPTTTTTSGPSDPAPARIVDVQIAAVGRTNATLRWTVANCAATTWVAYQDATQGAGDGWARTPAQAGIRAFEANLTALAPGHRFIASVQGTDGSCGGPWGIAPSADLCFETLPLDPACPAPDTTTARPSSSPNTVSFLTAPEGYEVFVANITPTSAILRWRGPTCSTSHLEGYIRTGGSFSDFTSPTFRGRGPHVHAMARVAGAEVEFRVQGCAQDSVSFCFRVNPTNPRCDYSGHTIAPLFTPATAGGPDGLRARPALAVGIGLACIVLLGLGRLRARLE